MTFSPHPRLLVFALLAGLSLTSHLPAQTIVWQQAQFATSAADVLTNGTFVSATAAYEQDLTINGVTFASFNSDSHLQVGYVGAWQTNDDPFFSSGDLSYDRLLNNGSFTSADGAPENVVLSGLTVGHTYQVQFFAPAWDHDWPTQVISGVNIGILGNTAGNPAYIVGTFTADSDSLTFQYGLETSSYGLFAAASVRDLSPPVTGSAVPEPSTYAALLGAVSLGGVLLWRRRQPRAA